MNSTIIISKTRLFLFLSVLISGFNAWSQEPMLINGSIEAASPNVEKIHVINLTQEKGAVTNAAGEFKLMANLNDSIYISSVQFQNKTIVVSSQMMREGKMNIRLEDKMNELAEVMIDDIQLSGHLANDLNKISIANVQNQYRLQNDLNTFIKKDRELNPYEKPNLAGGLRLDRIAGAVIDKLSSNRLQEVKYSPREIANKSIAIVGQEFFREDLHLDANEICNFVYFCIEDSGFKRLVLNDNAFMLIEYFQTRIGDFRDMRGAGLNSSSQIPG